MAQRPVLPPRDGADVRVLDGSFRLVVVLAGLLLGMTGGALAIRRLINRFLATFKD